MAVTLDMLARIAAPAIETDRGLAFTRKATATAFAYWDALRGTRKWPARKDLALKDMKAFMPHVGLVEVRKMADGRRTFFIRYAGARIESVYGPITGKTLGEFLPAQLEGRWRMVFEAALAEKAPVRFATRVLFGGKDYLAAEILLAPLGETDEVTMLYAAIEVWPAMEAPQTA